VTDPSGETRILFRTSITPSKKFGAYTRSFSYDLVGPIPAQHNPRRIRKNVEIEPDRPVPDAFLSDDSAVGEGSLTAPANLPTAITYIALRKYLLICRE
jgi:hypothetical protein